MKRWLAFAALVLLFTCFGQRRATHWVYVGTDREQQHYYYDERSLEELAPKRFRLTMRRSPRNRPEEGGRERVDEFVLDCEAGTIQGPTDAGPVPIPADSVAATLARRVCPAQRTWTSPDARSTKS